MPDLNKEIQVINDIQKNELLSKELSFAGMTEQEVAKLLFDLCNFKTIKIDKNGDVHESIDGHLRLKALDLWCKITGSLAATKKESKELSVNIKQGMSDEKAAELIRIADKNRKAKRYSK